MGKIKTLTLAVGLGVFLAACGGGEPITGDFVPNTAPNTKVSATPPSLTAAGFEVSFNWSGSDPDGALAGFEWRISNNGEDGIVDVEDTLEVNLPWSFTTVTDSTFEVSAEMDSFPADVADGRLGESNFRFWQTHTFYIRAVDDQGAVDPTPAHVSFTATTLAPSVRINLPDVPIPPDCIFGPQVLTFGWAAEDPDFITREPAAIRYLLIPYQTQTDPPACKTRTNFLNDRPIRHDDPLWSRWIPWDAANDSAKIVTFDKQPLDSRFLFAVQARDVAGAVTPTFEWGRNVRHIMTTGFKYPNLTVNERFLGTESVASTNNVKEFDVAEGQELQFTWSANAADYGGLVDAYRFGWDVADPDDPNDPGWAVNWGDSPAHRQARNSYQQGTHNFVVQCRDNSGTRSRYVAILNVIQVPALSEQRSLLFIDDWKDADGDPIDAQWDDQWRALLQNVIGFQNADMIESSTDGARIRLSRAVEYRSMIWFVNFNEQSYLHQRFAPLNINTPQFNWLEIYQGQVGNLLLVGPGVASRSVENSGWIYPLVFNVPATPELGFGTFVDIDGVRKNRGTTRYPYTSWCVEVVDRVRPGVKFIFGEHEGSGGILVRDGNCDGLHTAEIDTTFLSIYADAGDAGVGNLNPQASRLDFNNKGIFGLLSEEVYNHNGTTRSVAILPRPCQLPMYRWRARRDMQPSLIPGGVATCKPPGREHSTFDGGACAIVSRVYENSKPVARANDFLWGFHPLSFRSSDVSRTLDWMMRRNWQIPLR